MLARRVGEIGVVEADRYELCCFVSHNQTSTQVALWRDRRRRQLVLAFRGTSDIVDALTDVNLLQTPLEESEGGEASKPGKGEEAQAVTSDEHLLLLLIEQIRGNPTAETWQLSLNMAQKLARSPQNVSTLCSALLQSIAHSSLKRSSFEPGPAPS